MSRNPGRQCGAVLLIAMIMLLVLTLLATSSMREATLQSRISGVVGEEKLALNAAESALREGERKLAAYSQLDEGAGNCATSTAAHAGLCILNSELGGKFFDYAAYAGTGGELEKWWSDSSYSLAYSGSDDTSSFAASPRWNVALWDPSTVPGFSSESTEVNALSTGEGEAFYFVVTAYGEAGGKRLKRVLQSVTKRSY